MDTEYMTQKYHSQFLNFETKSQISGGISYTRNIHEQFIDLPAAARGQDEQTPTSIDSEAALANHR